MTEKTKLINKNQMKRIFHILQYLTNTSEENGRTKIQIIKKLENKDIKTSNSTFYRTLSVIKYEYGIEISFKNDWYYIENQHSSDFQSLMSFLETVVTAELFNIGLQEGKEILEYVEFEIKQESIYSAMQLILNALNNRQKLSFNHHSFYHLEEKEYEILPFFIKQYQNRWYLIGETNKGLRSFGIDRMSKILTLGEIKMEDYTEKVKNAKENFENVVGLNYSDHPKERIRLSFDISQKPYLTSLKLHGSQTEITTEDSSKFVIDINVHPNFELEQQILKYGNMVKVLQPKWLSEKIKNNLKLAYKQYT